MHGNRVQWPQKKGGKHVVAYFGLDPKTIKNAEKQYLAETLGPPDLLGLDVIAMDEFAIQKGQRYATVFMEPQSKRVLWVMRGRGREDIRPFFKRLGEAGRRRMRRWLPTHQRSEVPDHPSPSQLLVAELVLVVAQTALAAGLGSARALLHTLQSLLQNLAQILPIHDALYVPCSARHAVKQHEPDVRPRGVQAAVQVSPPDAQGGACPLEYGVQQG